MTTNLTEGKPFKLILYMAFPILIGNIFQQLYNTVDAIIVGRYLGSEALAAVGSTNSVYILIMWFVCGMSGGFAVILAQHFGAGDKNRFRSSVCIAIELSSSITIVITIISLIFLKSFMKFMNMPDEIFDFAYSYLFIIIAGMLATVSYNLFAAILRSMGDSKSPFVFIIISSVVNIALDMIFIRVFNMGVIGAGLATVLSQAISGILCAVYMVNHFEYFKFRKEDFKFDLSLAKKMLSYGIPSGLCGVTTAIGILVLQVAINTYGTTTIAGYTAAIKVQNLAEVFFNAVSMTMMNYSGQNLGAGRIDRLQKGFRQSMLLSFIIAIIFGIVSIFYGGSICSIFVSDASTVDVIAFASTFLKYNGSFYIPFGILLITRSSLQGMGFRSAPVTIGVIESVFRIAGTMYLLNNRSEIVLCLISPIIWTVTAVVLIIMYFMWIKHLKRTIKVI